MTSVPAGYSPSFDIMIYERSPFTVIEIHGDVDAVTCGALHDAVRSVLTRPTGIIFDATHLIFIDSSGLRVILETWHHLGPARMAVVGLAPRVRHVFTTLGLTDRLPVFDDVDEAVGALTRQTLPSRPIIGS